MRAIFFLLSLVLAAPGVAFDLTDRVQTTDGPIRGVLDAGVHTFKGIPYAAPPVGARRFRPPEPVTPWRATFDAIDFGAPAMQDYGGSSDTELGWRLAEIFPMNSEMKIDNEDCLYLNVWSPSLDGERRPVMVWLHGGGFSYGSGAWPSFDGANMARVGDVVFVTLNHRLNVFGHLYLDPIDADFRGAGNAGMLDIVAALEWIRDNIAVFGGDPDNVTILGESGGGMKVSTLLAMPAARGLIHRAVIQSGAGLEALPQDVAERSSRALIDEMGGLERLAGASADEILAAMNRARMNQAGVRFAPVVDGAALPRHPFSPGAPQISDDVPILIGVTKDELSLFSVFGPGWGSASRDDGIARVGAAFPGRGDSLYAAYEDRYPGDAPDYVTNALFGDVAFFLPSIELAERKHARGKAPVYMYRLEWETPVAGGIFKSPHTLDIPLAFKNVDKSEVLTGDGEAYLLERFMSNAWLAFARSGDPNTEDLPDWPAYTPERRATMLFRTQPAVVDDPLGNIRKMLQGAD